MVLYMFKSGLRIAHPLFGIGTIRAVAGSGPETKLTIDFAPSVGQKKLLASVANLKLLEAGDATASAPAVAPSNAWFEILEAEFALRPGQRQPADDVHHRIQADVSRSDFWVTVRERVRAAGKAPRVLDDLDGHVSVRSSGNLILRVIVKHGELVRADDAVLGQAIATVLIARQLQEYHAVNSRVSISIVAALDDDYVVTVQEAELGELPDRAPKRRPVREQPKGQIRARPKRRDDY